MIKNYLNYAGSKDRYYPLIREHLKRALGRKKKGKYLIDAFCGSGVVAFNSMDIFENIMAIDKCEELITIHNWVRHTDTEELLKEIDGTITSYDLRKDDKEGFLRLREDYNNLIAEGSKPNAVWLFCLIMYSFNYSLHLNKSGGFNCPHGTNRSSFNNSLRTKLKNYKEHLDNNKDSCGFAYLAGDIFTILNPDNPDKSLFSIDRLNEAVFFIDPPYSAAVSKHPYRVGNIKWSEDDDRKLFEVLDIINENKGKFVFTNVFENNGVSNRPLQEWAKNYKVHDVGVSYDNCNYQRKNNGKTREVIITNF